MENELLKLKLEVRRLRHRLLIITLFFLVTVLISSGYKNLTVIQANRFEIIDSFGNVLLTLDKNGISNSTQNDHVNNNWNNNRHNDDKIRFLFNRMGSSSGVIQISNLTGESIETITYYSQFDEKIIINNQVAYLYNKTSKEVSFQNALSVGNAETIEKAIDLAVFHFVNKVYEPKR